MENTQTFECQGKNYVSLPKINNCEGCAFDKGKCTTPKDFDYSCLSRIFKEVADKE